MAAAPPPGRAVVNVNVPGGHHNGQIRVTRLGRRPEGVGRIVEHGDAYYLYGLPGDPAPPHEDVAGTDFHALSTGAVSATPISLDWHDPDHPTRLRDWLREITRAAEPVSQEVA
jgi:broad specificity polyphosphatase/5'/3'-nucleotidase SurE